MILLGFEAMCVRQYPESNSPWMQKRHRVKPSKIDHWILSSIFGVWAALTNHSKRWGASPPTFWKGFGGYRGRPDPKSRRFPAGAQKPCIKHPSVSEWPMTLFTRLRSSRVEAVAGSIPRDVSQARTQNRRLGF